MDDSKINNHPFYTCIKGLCLFLLLINVDGVLAQSPDAPSSGDGTSAGTAYEIGTLNNLYWLAEHVNSNNDCAGVYFKQTANIDASSTSSWFSGQGWLPIGYAPDGNFDNAKFFSGIYDGQNYAISNLYLNRTPFFCTALFGIVVSGTVKNLKVTSASITGGGTSQYCGILVGYLYGGSTIENCHVLGSVSGDINVGGVIGYDDGTNGGNSTSYCSANCTVSGYSNVGGLIGDCNLSSVSQSYSSGSVTCTALASGGLIGNAPCQVTDCYSTANVYGVNKSGGLAGEIYESSSITNSYSAGTVTGSSNVGGLIGSISSGSPTVTSSFWDIEASGQSGSAAGTGKTTAQMQTASTYTGAGWDLTTLWGHSVSQNNQYPYLAWQSVFTPTVTTSMVSTYHTTTATMGGNVTANGGATVTDRGVVYSTSDNTPAIGKAGVVKEANGSGNGTYSESIASLSENTTYYIRAYATNEIGTSYGAVVSFTTLQYPIVSTQAVSSILVTTATGNGNITSLGNPSPTQYGVVWGASANPTVDLLTKTTQGVPGGTGAFTSSITGLSAATTYL